MAKSSAIPTVGRNREITLPAAIRRRVRDASQMYFWTDEWQRGEHEAQEDIPRGITTTSRDHLQPLARAFR